MFDLKQLIKQQTGVSIKEDKQFFDESYRPYFLGARLLTKYAKRFNKDLDEKELDYLLNLFLTVVKAIARASEKGSKTMEYYCKVLENPKNFDKNDVVSLLAASFSKFAEFNELDVYNSYIVAQEFSRLFKSGTVYVYLNSRKKITKHLARIGLKIIRKYINDKEFSLFAHRILYCSDLLDAVLDIKKDRKKGSNSFKVGFFEIIKISRKLVVNFSLLFLKYPFIASDSLILVKRINRVKF